MGIEDFPVLEGQDPYECLHWAVEWKCLSECLRSEALEAVARELGILPLGHFYSYTRQDAMESLSEEEVEEEEEDAELKDGRYFRNGQFLWSAQRQWFEAAEAMKTTRGLLDFIASHPDRFDGDEAEEFVYILGELERALTKAATNNQRFYLTSNC